MMNNHHGLDARNTPTIVPGLIVFDGPIGTGKTTFINRLRDELTQAGSKVLVIDEVIPDNLEEYYKDPSRNVYEFQKNFVLSLFEKWRNLFYNPITPFREYDYVLCDRYWASTRAFVRYHHDKGNINDDQLRNLSDIINLFISLCPVYPEYFIFIDECNQTCLERIKARGRPGEAEVGEAYMAEINEYIRRYNAFPFFGEGPPSSMLNIVSERVTPFVAQRQALAIFAQRVKCIHLTKVEENTTHGFMLPDFTEVCIGADLVRTGPPTISSRQFIMEEAAIIASSNKPADEVTKLTSK